MSIVIVLLTFVLIVTCLLLILLVLIQLPKKETGAGLAFGAGATDALFGAGSGNVLTKVTKYVAGAFLVLAMVLAVLNINHHNRNRGTETIQQELEKASRVPLTPTPAAPPAAPAAAAPLSPNLAPVTVPQSPAPAPAPAPADAPKK